MRNASSPTVSIRRATGMFMHREHGLYPRSYSPCSSARIGQSCPQVPPCAAPAKARASTSARACGGCGASCTFRTIQIARQRTAAGPVQSPNLRHRPGMIGRVRGFIPAGDYNADDESAPICDPRPAQLGDLGPAGPSASARDMAGCRSVPIRTPASALSISPARIRRRGSLRPRRPQRSRTH